MKHCKKIICLALLALLLLTGCGKKNAEFQVIFAAPYVSDELAEAYGESLAGKWETPVRCIGFSFGSEDYDASMYGASAMAMSAMVAAGEVNILVCDLEEAARYGRSGLFYDPTQLFTAEELSGWEEKLVRFDLVDETGQPTGEQTPPCGLELSGRKDLTEILASERYGIFLIGIGEDEAMTKEVFWAIANG